MWQRQQSSNGIRCISVGMIAHWEFHGCNLDKLRVNPKIVDGAFLDWARILENMGQLRASPKTAPSYPCNFLE